MKLLREGAIQQAELFVLDMNTFKKVTVVPFTSETPTYGVGLEVVYLHNRGQGSKLRTSQIIDKDGFKVADQPGGHIDEKDIVGVVIKTEILKEKTPEQMAETQKYAAEKRAEAAGKFWASLRNR